MKKDNQNFKDLHIIINSTIVKIYYSAVLNLKMNKNGEKQNHLVFAKEKLSLSLNQNARLAFFSYILSFVLANS